MAPRATFKGFLRLSLVSVPVKAYTATATDKEIRLNQLHRDCNSRIRYKKTCPVHGEVKSDEIVSGYEYAKDQYVVIDPSEVAKLRKKSDKSIDISGFIDAGEIEPMYFSGKMYYLMPDGVAGNKPYQLLRDTMRENDLLALASAVIGGREQMVIVRPVDSLLAMSVLQYASKVKKPKVFEEEIEKIKVTKEEISLTKTLVAASMIDDFDFDSYTDDYTGQLTKIVEAKIEGEEIVTAPDVEEPKVINLMEALKASVQNAKASAVKPKVAPSKRRAGATKKSTARAKKRKSG